MVSFSLPQFFKHKNWKANEENLSGMLSLSNATLPLYLIDLWYGHWSGPSRLAIKRKLRVRSFFPLITFYLSFLWETEGFGLIYNPVTGKEKLREWWAKKMILENPPTNHLISNKEAWGARGTIPHGLHPPLSLYIKRQSKSVGVGGIHVVGPLFFVILECFSYSSFHTLSKIQESNKTLGGRVHVKTRLQACFVVGSPDSCYRWLWTRWWRKMIEGWNY